MVIGFGDIGTAWTGKNPYSTDNSFNTSIVNGHNYNITIQNQKEPLITVTDLVFDLEFSDIM